VFVAWSGFVYKSKFQEDFERALIHRFPSHYALRPHAKVPPPLPFSFSLSRVTQIHKEKP
jgi:hypothetical protein